MDNDAYELVIGLEVHAQLSTASKLFCADDAGFGGSPNSHVSTLSLAHPGTLPVLNKKAVEYALRLGLALDCTIHPVSHFARKNYFYPDLPKGYQISQHTDPICTGGFVEIPASNGSGRILLNRIHIEEDAGKSIHDAASSETLLDFNRAGVALLEIVTEPVIHSAEEAARYLTSLRKTVRWLDICDGNMEEGSFRCDVNLSVRPMGATQLGTRVEIKNLNSIRHVKQAIAIEAERLTELARSGQVIKQETRSYDEAANTTFALRSKEEAEDYRYFADPDLPPVRISEEFISEVRASMPETATALQQKFREHYGLSEYDAEYLCGERELAAYFEAVANVNGHYKPVANWLMGPVQSHLNAAGKKLAEFELSPATLSSLILLVENGTLSFSQASGRIFAELLKSPGEEALVIAHRLQLVQESDSGTLEAWIEQVLESLPEKVKEYRSGKKGLLGLFAGEVKKRSKGKADMEQVMRLLSEKLGR